MYMRLESSQGVGATVSSSGVRSAVSSTQRVHSPSGASEKIFVPHFRQTLVTVIMTGELLAHSPSWYCVKFYRTLSCYYRNYMAQLIFDIARRSNCVGNFLS